MATLSDAKRLVIKIGSALLVDRDTGALRAGWLTSLAEDVAWLKGAGKDIQKAGDAISGAATDVQNSL